MVSNGVKPKKHLGQHFLKDIGIAQKVAHLFKDDVGEDQILEIGPGMGVLTQFLLQSFPNVKAVEIDTESVRYLENTLVKEGLDLIEGDFLQMDTAELAKNKQLFVVGNFPYNISSQIVFKVLEAVPHVKGFGGMFQKEVAERLVAKKGSKTYGILSVFLNAYYDCTYEFTIEPNVFIPPPKVKSGVIRCTRKEGFVLPCDRKLFFEVVKAGFNQRRKTLRNALHKFNLKDTHEFAKLRAEQLSVEDFISLTQDIQKEQ
ncbi:MAG: 16S rRNA (adenine(1518)-N(6)/adenine(1519)-N(6))-dimethyltransferase RsmA [Bacteroidetes bacterium]|nr:16S rRNA (adenine(1518)-N(6)/adenine(1519)-N(6))-dimethyltransferase RsmA [Bacteroidota bacterium]